MASVIDASSADGSVASNKDNGVLYWVATASATQPSEAQIQNGLDHLGAAAVASGSQAIGQAGEQTIFGGVIGLAAGQTYRLHFYMETDALVGSNVITSNAFVPADVMAPVLSSAEGSQTGATTANLTVNTDTAEGTLYWVVTESPVTPSSAQIVLGEDEADLAASAAGSRAVSASGPQAFGITGLVGDTEYWAHFVQIDAAGNVSDPITVSASFTTPSITYYFQAFHNGIATPALNSANSVFTGNYADSLGGSNAILWSGDGLGPASPTVEAVQMATTNTFANGVTRLKCKFKVITSVNAKMWLRIRPLNVTSPDLVYVDISNDATADGSRLGMIDPTVTNVSVTSLSDGWKEVSIDYNMTGDVDRVGNLVLYMATANNVPAVINNVAGANQIAIHDLRFQQL